MTGKPVLRPLDSDESLAEEGKSLADDEVDAFVDLHFQLFVEGLAYFVRGRRTVGFVHPGEAEIAGHQAFIAGDFASDSDGGAVEVLELVVKANRRQLVAAGVEGQRLEDIRASFAKFDVQLAESVRMQQGNFGSERTRAHPAALFELQQVTAVAQDWSVLEASRECPSSWPCKLPFFVLRFVFRTAKYGFVPTEVLRFAQDDSLNKNDSLYKKS